MWMGVLITRGCVTLLSSQVSQYSEGIVVDSKCRGLTSSWVRAEVRRALNRCEECDEMTG
jgi:hypothetical protein